MKLARFIGFTSAVGGSGTSSGAMVFARSVAKSTGKKVILLCFDILSSKCFGQDTVKRKDLIPFISENGVSGINFSSKENSEGETVDKVFKGTVMLSGKDGVAYFKFDSLLNPLCLDAGETEDLIFNVAEDFDIVVLDIPANNCAYTQLKRCEDVVVVGTSDKKNEMFNDDLCKIINIMSPNSKIHRLYVDMDDSNIDFESDDALFSDFGSRVRKIACDIGL